MNRNRLEHLLKGHHKDAFMWASHCCNYNHEEAKEVLQLTYLKVLEGKARYGERAAFKTWLFSVIRFTAIDYLKAQRTFEDLDGLDIVQEEPGDNPDSINYKKLLNQLPNRQQQVLLLSFYHGMTLEEIAGITELHIGTVRTHYQRGKEALRNLILKENHV